MILPPTQQASVTLVTSMVRSIVDDIEKRRLEDEEKASGRKQDDKVLKARIKPDAVAQTANARINEHFFGALKQDESPLAQLRARFLGALGIAQEKGESDVDFGTRVEDALVLVTMIGKAEAQTLTKKTVTVLESLTMPKVSLARFRVSVEELEATISGENKEPSQMMQVLARYAGRLGIEREEGEAEPAFSERFGKALAGVRASMVQDITALEKKSGLRDLGVTAAEMVEAIKHPYGEAAQKIATALDDRVSEEKFLTADVAKVLQRLEEVADPKTIEELKADRLEKDPTKVHDAETRKEREEAIRSLEAGEKLEDIEELNDAIAKGNDAAIKDEDTPGPDADGTAQGIDVAAIQTIQVLAAGLEIAETQAVAESSSSDTTAAALEEKAAEVREAPSDEDQAVMLARAGGAAEEAREAAAKDDILAVSIDENGIYDLLAKKEAA
ncbi:hypothetical protein [Pararhizobium gei]|uniref:hypothetical protein n=1 Tax=Pararhizobium gei TaxID=1395951 RepID=UPI0023DBF2A4|nr:hypothetical protein [Rhizobium gei]